MYTYILIQVGKTKKKAERLSSQGKKKDHEVLASGERPRLQISTNRHFERLDCLFPFVFSPSLDALFLFF